MHLSFLSLVSLLSLLAVAGDSAQRRVYSLRSSPSGWTRLSRAPSDDPLTLRIALHPASGSSASLHEALLAVSTPGDERYGEHLSRDELGALVAPSAEASSAVKDWLAEGGVEASAVTASAGGDILHVSTTVAQAAKLLSAEYWTFESTGHNSRRARRTLSWSLPASVADAVSSIYPTTLFPDPNPPTRPKMQRLLPGKHDRRAPIKHKCASKFTLQCARTEYDMDDVIASKPSRPQNQIAIFQDGAYANKTDLKLFLETYAPELANITFKSVRVAGSPPGPWGDPNDIEAAIDIQILLGLTGSHGISVYTAPDDADVPGAEWPSLMQVTDLLLDQEITPSILSISYGDLELLLADEATNTTAANSMCDAFAKLGARGTTIVTSSGDDGATPNCNKDHFLAQFPASCPWVLTVGGTNYTKQSYVEQADIISGSGFSDLFGRPSYQDETVKAWLKNNAKHDKTLNTTGRAYPDVAAHSERDWPIVFFGEWYKMGGTSAACPTVAAVIALLNEVQLQAGKKRLGFATPWIYQNGGKGWQDVTQGANFGCSNGVGFNATVGWDPSTGFGFPSYSTLVSTLP